MDLLDALITVWSHPFGWLAMCAVFYVFYACLRIAWDVLRALTMFD